MSNYNLEDMSAKDIFRIVWDRKILLVMVAVATILIGSFLTIILPEKLYTAQMVMEVSNPGTILNISPSKDLTPQNVLYEIINPLQMEFETYVENITSDVVLEKTILDLKLEEKYSVKALRSKLNVNSNADDKTIAVEFSSPDPQEAIIVLNTLSENFVDYTTASIRDIIEGTLENLKVQIEIKREKYVTAFKKYEEYIFEHVTMEEYLLEKDSIYKRLLEQKSSLTNLEIREEGIKGALGEYALSSDGSGAATLTSSATGSVYIGDAKKALEIELAEVLAMKKSTAATIEQLNKDSKQAEISFKKAEVDETSLLQQLSLSIESYQSLLRLNETFDAENESLNYPDSEKLGITIVSKPEEAKTTESYATLKLLMLIIIGFTFGVISTFIKAYVEFRKSKAV